jgi:hypothetical protein
MGGELFKELMGNFGRMCGQMPDKRRPGHNERYEIADFVKSVFGVFFSAPADAGLPAEDAGTAGAE